VYTGSGGFAKLSRGRSVLPRRCEESEDRGGTAKLFFVVWFRF
jgi:hypothetical protein